MNAIKSLSHSKCNCNYHIVFAPKHRRQVIYGKLKVEIGKILRKLCEPIGVEIIQAEDCPDHIHVSEYTDKHGSSRFYRIPEREKLTDDNVKTPLTKQPVWRDALFIYHRIS